MITIFGKVLVVKNVRPIYRDVDKCSIRIPDYFRYGDVIRRAYFTTLPRRRSRIYRRRV